MLVNPIGNGAAVGASPRKRPISISCAKGLSAVALIPHPEMTRALPPVVRSARGSLRRYSDPGIAARAGRRSAGIVCGVSPGSRTTRRWLIEGCYLRASSTRLNGVSVARRKREKPAPGTTPTPRRGSHSVRPEDAATRQEIDRRFCRTGVSRPGGISPLSDRRCQISHLQSWLLL